MNGMNLAQPMWLTGCPIKGNLSPKKGSVWLRDCP